MIDGPDTQAWLNAQNDQPGDQSAYYFANDAQEAQKFNEFYPKTTNGTEAAPWWAALATYGATRAIDAAVGPRMNGSGGQQSTYAGQNGQTYANGRQVQPTQSAASLLPLLLGALAMFAFS